MSSAFPNAIKGELYEIPVLGWGKVLEVYPSFNREVFLWQSLRDSKDIRICKTFPEPNGAEAEAKIKLIHDYYQSLREAGVKVVNKIEFPTTSASGGILVIQTEEYCGQSQEDLLLDGKTDLTLAKALVQSALHCCYLPLLEWHESERPCRLRLGLDLLPRNMVSQQITGHWATTYIDLVPVKTIALCGQHLLELVEPDNPVIRKLGIFRHYNAAGLLISYWAQLAKLRPEWGRELLKEIEKFLRDNDKEYVAQEVIAYFNGFKRSICRTNPEKVSALIAACGQEDLIRLRVIACYIGSAKQLSEAAKEQVKEHLRLLFSLTHFQSEQIPEENMRQGKDVVVRIAALP